MFIKIITVFFTIILALTVFADERIKPSNKLKHATATIIKQLPLNRLPPNSGSILSTRERKNLAVFLSENILKLSDKQLKKPDVWLKNYTEDQEEDHGRRVFSFTKKQGNNWIAICPGDLIYYNGAFGIKEMPHFGIYIGRGFVIEFWCNDDMFKIQSYNGAIVLNSIEFFKTGANQVRSIYFGKSSPNIFRKIQIISRKMIKKIMGIRPLKRRTIIHYAALSVGQDIYKIFSNNCQHFALFLATGKHPYFYQLLWMRYLLP